MQFEDLKDDCLSGWHKNNATGSIIVTDFIIDSASTSTWESTRVWMMSISSAAAACEAQHGCYCTLQFAVTPQTCPPTAHASPEQTLSGLESSIMRTIMFVVSADVCVRVLKERNPSHTREVYRCICKVHCSTTVNTQSTKLNWSNLNNSHFWSLAHSAVQSCSRSEMIFCDVSSSLRVHRSPASSGVRYPFTTSLRRKHGKWFKQNKHIIVNKHKLLLQWVSRCLKMKGF